MLKMLQKLRNGRAADERGLTVIEMLVAMIVLAIIMTPLLMSFITSLTVADSTGDQYRGAANRDRLATFLSRDAASVDAAGVSVVLGCKTAGQPTDDTLLASFSTTHLEDDGSYTTSRASYWVSGSGTATQLVRRSCENVNLGSATMPTDGVQNIVATRIGLPNTTAATHLDLAHGPDDGGSIRRNPCDEISCTIVVAGENAFQSTAQRRVFGAGVPIEINKLYSSSADPSQDDATKTANRLVHTTLAGADTTEALWPGQISLAPGIDPPPAMAVGMRLQQRFTTGGSGATDGQELYLQDDGSWGSADNWADATFDTVEQRWALPLPTTKFTRGGEYRVWTQLTPTDEPAKVYGGSDPTLGGFPLWVDWKVQDSVFVSATSGDDANSGLKPTESVKTLTRALKVAYDGGRAEIHVLSAGSFDAVTIAATGTGQTRNNTALIGGYAATDWTRGAVDTTPGAPSTIAGPSAGTNAGTGLVVTGAVRDVRFRQIALDSGSTTDVSRTAYGLKVLGGAGVILEQSKVTARDGGTFGASGTQGAIGTSGCLGQQGYQRTTSANDRFGVPFEYLTGPDGQPYLVGPVPTNCTVQSRALRGGHGGAGGSDNSNGQQGSAGRGLSPGAGGPGKSSENCVGGGVDNTTPGNGGNRPSGQLAATSGFGGGKGSNTSTMGTAWQPANGQPGIDGKAGSGGGGSGGGGARYCFGTTNGGQGASAGDGGQGGTGGEGGLAGGSSFGIYLFGASSSAVIRSTVIESGDGGIGKDGGNGGNGGQGGAGGPGNTQGTGGNTSGAGGGAGGDGGGVGGTGEGGWSVPVITANAAGTVDLDASVTLLKGQPGQSGDNIQDNPPPNKAPIEWVPGTAGYGGTGGAGVNHSTFFGLINWSTKTAADGARGLAAAYPSGGKPATIGAAGKGDCLLWVGGVPGSCATS